MPERTRTETEKLLQEGCRRLIREKRNGIKINIKQTAFDLNVPYTTLRNRFLNSNKPAKEAHASQQFLSPSQETLLVKWIEHLAILSVSGLYELEHSIFTQTTSDPLQQKLDLLLS
jgi:hypothetical protein